MSVTVYGASDDLIEIEGDIRDEFTARDGINYLAFSNGTVLSIEYDRDGMWRIRPLLGTGGTVRLVIADDPEGNYTDRATIEGAVVWVVHGTEWARR